MNLEQIEIIQTIVDKGSFRAAAEHLHRSQPALSASIKNLEDELGLRIFDRGTYRPTLTEKGAVFFSAARKALDAARAAARVGRELGRQTTETRLRVAVDPLAPLQAIEWIARECARPAVPVMLILDRTILHGSLEKLLDGSIDLAVAPCPKDAAEIEALPFTEVSLVGAVSKKLLPAKRTANAAFLNAHAQILVYDKDVDGPAAALGPSPAFPDDGPKIFAPDHFTKLRLIENGFGWGRISKTEFEKSKGLAPLDRRSCAPVNLELCLLRAKHRPLGPVARRIWTVFHDNRL